MKSINRIKITLLAAVALFATSCLDLQPLASLGDEYVWTNESNVQLFANQFYSWNRNFTGMLNGSENSGGVNRTYADLRSDIVGNKNAFNEYSRGTHVVPNTDGNYGTTYKRIYYCNLLLKNTADYSNKSAIATPIGEAYFCRAILYFELLRLYGDAIVITEPLDITSSKLYASQDNRDVVADRVIADFKSAIEWLPDTASEAGRWTKDVARANLARAALYEGTWQKFHNHCSGGARDNNNNGNFDYNNFGTYKVSDVIQNTTRSTSLLTTARDAAKEVMDGGAFQLFRNPILGDDSYRSMFFLDDAAQCNIAGVGKSANTEYIHVYRLRDGDKSQTVTHSVLDNAFIPTRKMVDMYLCTNGLPIENNPLFGGRADYSDEFKNRDPRMAASILVEDQLYWDCDGNWRVYWDDRDSLSMRIVKKMSDSGYLNRKWGTERQCVDGYESADFPILRYAEVLLAYAEAVYELDNAISDADLDISLNLVRGRVSMPSLSNSFVDGEDNMCMREEIRRERTVELYMEGFRYDDIKRWAVGSTEMPGDMLGVLWKDTKYETNWSTGNLPNGVDADGNVIFQTGRSWVDTKHYHFPLPLYELQLNPNLRQNAGW